MDTNNNENLEKEVTTTDTTNTEVAAEEVKVEEAKEQVVTDTPVVVPAQEGAKAEKTKKEESKKKSKFLPIFMCVVGVLCLGVGIFLTVTTDDNDSEKSPVNENTNNNLNNNNNNNNTNNNTNNNNSAVAYIKDFIDYNKFEMNGIIKMASEDMSIEMTENGKYDALSNVYYIESNTMGFTSYEYYDLNNKMVYSSPDNVAWGKNSDEEIAFPVFPGTVIGKVKTNEGVTDLGNGSYSLNMDPAELPDMDGYTGKVPTTATFDANGYLTELNLDLTSLMASEGITEYIITYKFASVNTLDTVSVPDSVISGAVESEW